jgi:methylglyoxal synthase
MTSPAVLKKHQVIALINFDEKLSSLINHCQRRGAVYRMGT